MSSYDEFGNYIGSEESGQEEEEQISEEESGEKGMQVERVVVEENRIVLNEDKEYYGQVYDESVEIRVEDQDNQPLTEPIIAKRVEKLKPQELRNDKSVEYMLYQMNAAPSKSVCVVGGIKSGKTSLIEMIMKSQSILVNSVEIVDDYERGVGIGTNIRMNSVLCKTSTGKIVLLYLIDTIGQSQYMNEVVECMQVSDVIVFVLDSYANVFAHLHLFQFIRKAKKKCIFVFNFLDKFIFELKLTPNEIYFKLISLIEIINSLLGINEINICNVFLASLKFNLLFNVESFVANTYPSVEIPLKFFTEARSEERIPFVYLILEPIVKMFTLSVSNDYSIQQTLAQYLPRQSINCLIDSIYACASPAHSESEDTLISIFKLIYNKHSQSFDCLAKVVSGTLLAGSTLSTLSADPIPLTMTDIFLPNSTLRIPIDKVTTNNFCLLANIDNFITQPTFLSSSPSISVPSPLPQSIPLVFRVAIEPMRPSDLPTMLHNLRLCLRKYSSLSYSVEESGQHVLSCTGEFYMDSVLYDMRIGLSDTVDIRVSDPFALFCSTVSETSSAVSTHTHDKFVIRVISEPLDQSIVADLDANAFSFDPSAFESRYGWDSLASHSVLSASHSNLLLNDTFGSLHPSVCSLLVQGFQWACREGPLCDEPVRGVLFRLISFECADPAYATPGMIVPAMRRVCLEAMLSACPCLLEPVYSVEVTCTSECLNAAHGMLEKRRGHVVEEKAIGGTPLYGVSGILPVMESWGWEVDLRMMTQGMAWGKLGWSSWETVMGDVFIGGEGALGRAKEWVEKMRRRKGLGDLRAVGR